MSNINCPECKRSFDNNNPESLVTRAAALTAGAVGGAWFGGGVGIVAGPLGGIAGTVPGAVIGGLLATFAVDQFRRCIHCGHIFKT